jgi:hypothetical protein
MLSLNSISAQSSFGLNGLIGISNESFSSLNSFEFNPSNYSVIKDWGFSFTYGGEFASSVTSNLYQVSAAKTFGRHFISFRYTPGYQKEFIFKSGSTTIDSTSEPVNLIYKFLFKELFGAGYSFKFNNQISAGLTLRYFKQEFTKDNVSIIFSDSSYFVVDSETDISDYWKTDIGFVWKPSENLTFNFASINLLTLQSEIQYDENKDFALKTEKSFLAGLNYFPAEDLNINLIYETNNSLVAGFSTLFSIKSNKLGFSFSAFHDKEQDPFFAGIIPSAIFISKYFDISLSWVNYFSDRKSTGSYSDFKENSISNIINNRFSFDKVLLTTNFKLNTLVEQRVKFIDVEIKQNIYPSLADRYVDMPIATATVLNLTNEKIDVKPIIQINGINEEKFQSPVISILPNDTVEVDFYAVFPDNYSSVNAELTYANFYLMTVNDDFDDEYQKALLVNGINAWDGNVHNLKYFIKRDLDFSVKYSKAILAKHKSEIDTLINSTSDFYKAKILFNAFIENLTYTSDPRATSEYVQYPKQTLELKGGDCDDLSVCYCSLLESIGIETALVDYKSNDKLSHVNLMFNTKLSPQQANLITENDIKYFIRKNENGEDEVWIPVEPTSLSDFDTAWSIASDKFQEEAINNFGLIKGEIEIVDIY